MTQVGSFLDKIFKSQIENKTILTIEKIIIFTIDELNYSKIKGGTNINSTNKTISKGDIKEWSDLKQKHNLFYNSNKLILSESNNYTKSESKPSE
jgi:hypothetical protein